jgi:hypothetical protein
MAWLAVKLRIAAKRLAAICEPAEPGAALRVGAAGPVVTDAQHHSAVGFLELESPPPCRLN